MKMDFSKITLATDISFLHLSITVKKSDKLSMTSHSLAFIDSIDGSVIYYSRIISSGEYLKI